MKMVAHSTSAENLYLDFSINPKLNCVIYDKKYEILITL